MKHSAVALLAFAQGIVAIPSLLGQIKQSQSKVLVPDQDISLSIKLSQVPMHRDKPQTKQDDICWLLCASEEIKCPDGWLLNATLSSLEAMPMGIIAFQ
ncbi:hypothetical protein J7337_012484 [Fusarium musae]|uniref:Uncharacterized protein n=1 Tax=Fusarium musae TaxID=1042133 RepID=A0A9P8D5W0_9HYPO|nr:hypothetical protein J7337_012484 [Fusarium musae]KAG9495918.1 hypothetical protein J7337_012484 [Fusarium musae]